MTTTRNTLAEQAGLSKWLRDPSSWLAAIATCISVATFLLVQACPGELVVVLPDRVGMKLKPPHGADGGRPAAESDPGSLGMLLPITLTNTGAPRTRKHVTRIVADLAPTGSAGRRSEVSLAWEFEHKFLGRMRFHQEYKEAEDEGTADYLEYEGRALPFALKGGESVTRLYELQGRADAQAGSQLNKFELRVTVETTGGQVQRAQQFVCAATPSTRIFQWCAIKERGTSGRTSMLATSKDEEAQRPSAGKP